MDKRLYDHLWTAFDLAKKEKVANPLSSRLTAVRDLAAQEREEQGQRLSTMEDLNAEIAATAGSTSFPTSFVRRSAGDNSKELADCRARLAELDDLLNQLSGAIAGR